jgi:hypothetical protein
MKNEISLAQVTIIPPPGAPARDQRFDQNRQMINFLSEIK